MLVVLIFCFCIIMNIIFGNCHNMKKDIINLRERLESLDEIKNPDYPDEVTDYFKFYSLNVDTDNIEHIFGTFESGSLVLVGHIYKPAEYKATVFLLHG